MSVTMVSFRKPLHLLYYMAINVRIPSAPTKDLFFGVYALDEDAKRYSEVKDLFFQEWAFRFFAGVAQLVERQPSKLAVAGSTPVARSIFEHK